MKTFKQYIIEASLQGIASNKSIQDLADKHNVSIDYINRQLNKGIQIELEHTRSRAIAKQIARDHLWEDCDYYIKLKKYVEQTNSKQLVVIYPGRFQPFHLGHFRVYKHLKEVFPEANIFITSSDKVEEGKSPFSFEQKKTLATSLGVKPSEMIQTKSPYQPQEIISNVDPEATTIIFAVSKKDMEENPRFSFKQKKDGSPSYFQPLETSIDLKPLSKHGYIYVAPTYSFKILNEPMISATDIREKYKKSNDQVRTSMLGDLYGSDNPNLDKIKQLYDLELK